MVSHQPASLTSLSLHSDKEKLEADTPLSLKGTMVSYGLKHLVAQVQVIRRDTNVLLASCTHTKVYHVFPNMAKM